MELRAGQFLGPYRLVDPAGRGGMAVVWRAYDARLNRHVAIKLLSPGFAADADYLERFRQEAQAISRLDHPNILTVHDFGEQDGWTYMVSPFLGGGTLAARLRRGPWTVDEALTVIEPLALALDYAHSAGIVHRDVKPSNVLFTEQGRLVLSDFGIARMLEGTTMMGQAGRVVGTPMYMAPEQADGKVAGPASDLYSLGVVAYEMLTGRPPFTGETPLALLRAHLDKPLPPPRTVNPALPGTIESALVTILAKDPRARFPSGREFVETLRTIHPVIPLPGPRPGPLPPGPLPRPAPPVPFPPPNPTPSTDRARWHDVPRRWPWPLLLICVTWAVAWILLTYMRQSSFESVRATYDAIVYDTLNMPYSPEDDRVIGPRALVSALFGLVGGAGVALALFRTRAVSDWRSVLWIVGGWTLSYGLLHAAFYGVALASSPTPHGLVLDFDHFLGWRARTTGLRNPALYVLPMGILPAIVGGCITAAVLRGVVRRWSVRLPIGWAIAAFLALVAGDFVDLTVRWYVGTGSAAVPVGHGVVVGLLAGAVQGLVGGWVTLIGLPVSSAMALSGAPSSFGYPAPPLPTGRGGTRRGTVLAAIVVPAVVVGGLIGALAWSYRSRPVSTSLSSSAATRPPVATVVPTPSVAASPVVSSTRTASPVAAASPTPAVAVATPAASPITRPGPPPQPKPGTVLVSESFDSVERSGRGLRRERFKDGEYALNLTAPPGQDIGSDELWIGEYVNTSIAIDVRLVGDPSDMEVKLSCRLDTDAEFTFIVLPDIGVYAFATRDPILGGPDEPIDFDPSPAVQRGTATNHLELHCIDDQMEAFANGRSLFTASGLNRRYGPTGIEVTGPTGREARVDNLVITQR